MPVAVAVAGEGGRGGVPKGSRVETRGAPGGNPERTGEDPGGTRWDPLEPTDPRSKITLQPGPITRHQLGDGRFIPLSEHVHHDLNPPLRCGLADDAERCLGTHVESAKSNGFLTFHTITVVFRIPSESRLNLA